MSKNNIISFGMILISIFAVTALAKETKNKPSQQDTFEEYFYLTDTQREICEELSTNDKRILCKALITQYNISNFENKALLQQAQELVDQDARERFKQIAIRNSFVCFTVSAINIWLNL